MAENSTEEQGKENAGEQQGGGRSKLIIIAIVIAVLAVAGFFAAPMIKNMISPPAEDSDEVVVEADTSKPALFAPLHPPLIVNFNDLDGEGHFMQLTLEVMAREQSVIDEVKNYTAMIRNSLILMLGNVDYDLVSTRAGKEQLLAEALTEIQTIIEAETGETGVEAVYFTSLIIQ